MFSYREVEWFILGWISRHNYVFLGQRPRETGYRLTVELLIAKTKKKGNNQIVTLSNFSREYNMRTFWQQILFLAQEGVWVNYPQGRRTFLGWGNQLSASCCFCKKNRTSVKTRCTVNSGHFKRGRSTYSGTDTRSLLRTIAQFMEDCPIFLGHIFEIYRRSCQSFFSSWGERGNNFHIV